MRSKRSWFALVVSSLLLGAACGGDDGPPALGEDPPLVRDLREGETERGLEATRRLVERGPGAVDVVPYLIRVLEDGSPEARSAAARVLSSVGPVAKEALPALEASLDHENGYVWIGAARALVALDADLARVVPRVIQGLDEEDPHLQFLATSLLVDLAPEAVDFAPVLGRRLRRGEGRAGALCKALARMGPTGADVLVDALAARDAQVRMAASSALLELDRVPAASIQKLVAALGAWESDTPGVLPAVVRKQGRAAVPDLTAALKSDNSRLRKHAVMLLGDIGSDARAAVYALQKLTEDESVDRDTRRMAEHAVQMIRGR